MTTTEKRQALATALETMRQSEEVKQSAAVAARAINHLVHIHPAYLASAGLTEDDIVAFRRFRDQLERIPGKILSHQHDILNQTVDEFVPSPALRVASIAPAFPPANQPVVSADEPFAKERMAYQRSYEDRHGKTPGEVMG